jgi:hypothetical protein
MSSVRNILTVSGCAALMTVGFGLSPSIAAGDECYWKGPPQTDIAPAGGPATTDDEPCSWKGPPQTGIGSVGGPSVGADGCVWKGPPQTDFGPACGPTWDDGPMVKDPYPIGGSLQEAPPGASSADKPVAKADVNGDFFIDVNDLIGVLNAWGQTTGPADCNGDGLVDAADLVTVLASWGVCG